jgi:biotin operon repressor
LALVYRRSHEIEKRLEEVLRLIRIGGYATPALAKALGVSIPTVSRCVMALRERGHNIQAKRERGNWQYVLIQCKRPSSLRNHEPSVDLSVRVEGRPS